MADPRFQYDQRLNPVRAEVDLQLTVTIADERSDDELAKGALEYTTIAKEAQAIANLANLATMQNARDVLRVAEHLVDLVRL